MKSSFFFTIMLSIALFPLFSQDKNKIIDLRGDWKFSIGNDDDWKNYSYNDAEWDVIKAPSAWENQGFYGYNGFACYRKKVAIPSKYKGFIFYLELGYIDDVDKVYFNGQLIGSTGSFPPNYTSAYNAKREYFIPGNLIKYDQNNVISITIYDSQQEGGIIGGDLGIYVSGMPIDMDFNLQGIWKFITGDDPDYKKPDYSDTQWGKIIVPSYWENQGYKDYDGYAWYRVSFKLNNTIPDDKLILLLGKIDDIDEVYLNGEWIGSTGSFEPHANNDNTWLAVRGYYFDRKLLKQNEVNTIAVRVLDFRGRGGICDGPIGIISQKKYIEYWRKKKMSNW